MSLYYTKTTLQDVEIKIHDARRKIEQMLSLAKLGIIPAEDEVVKLNTDLIAATTMVADYYIQLLNNFEESEIEEIVLESKEPESNVVPLFPNKNKNEE